MPTAAGELSRHTSAVPSTRLTNVRTVAAATQPTGAAEQDHVQPVRAEHAQQRQFGRHREQHRDGREPERPAAALAPAALVLAPALAVVVALALALSGGRRLRAVAGGRRAHAADLARSRAADRSSTARTITHTTRPVLVTGPGSPARSGCPLRLPAVTCSAT